MGTLFALATVEGQPIRHTALCADCWGNVEYRQESVRYALAESDYRTPFDAWWDFADWADYSEDGTLACTHCGPVPF